MPARAMEFRAYGASKWRNGTWNGHVRHVLGQGSTARLKVSPIIFLFCYLFAEAEHRSAFHLPSMGKGSWIIEHHFRGHWNHTKGPVPCDEWACFGTGENVRFWPKGHFQLAKWGQGVEDKGGRVQCLMAKPHPFSIYCTGMQAEIQPHSWYCLIEKEWKWNGWPYFLQPSLTRTCKIFWPTLSHHLLKKTGISHIGSVCFPRTYMVPTWSFQFRGLGIQAMVPMIFGPLPEFRTIRRINYLRMPPGFYPITF